MVFCCALNKLIRTQKIAFWSLGADLRIERALVEKVHSKGPCFQHIEQGDEITHIAGKTVRELSVGEFVGLAFCELEQWSP